MRDGRNAQMLRLLASSRADISHDVCSSFCLTVHSVLRDFRKGESSRIHCGGYLGRTMKYVRVCCCEGASPRKCFDFQELMHNLTRVRLMYLGLGVCLDLPLMPVCIVR